MRAALFRKPALADRRHVQTGLPPSPHLQRDDHGKESYGKVQHARRTRPQLSYLRNGSVRSSVPAIGQMRKRYCADTQSKLHSFAVDRRFGLSHRQLDLMEHAGDFLERRRAFANELERFFAQRRET